MKKKLNKTKKRNPQDITLRNLHARKRKMEVLEARVDYILGVVIGLQIKNKILGERIQALNELFVPRPLKPRSKKGK